MNPDHEGGNLAPTLPGRLGKYRIIARIGRGGMAEIYLAVTSGPAGFSKLHVLKHLRRETFDNDEAVRMFTAEARLSALLNHPNVVQVFEVGEDAGAVFMVMEYLEGQSLYSVGSRLQRMVPEARTRLEMRLRIVADVLNGLHYAHELRDLNGAPLHLVHRDVTPHNVFITYDGGIKLLDFGVAKTASSVTQAGTIKGKLAYLAPEQVTHPALVDRRTDIFQCGLILWEGLLGRRVWAGMGDYQILRGLATNTLPELVAPQEADPELVAICRRATAPRIEDRYETAEAFNTDVEAFIVKRGVRWTAKEVGAQVAALFAEQRSELRDAVRTRVSQVELEGRGEFTSESDGTGKRILSPPGDTDGHTIPTLLAGGSRPEIQTGSSSDGRPRTGASWGPARAQNTNPAVVPSVWSGARRTRLAVASLSIAVVTVLAGVVAWRLLPVLSSSASPVPQSSFSTAAPTQIELSFETIPTGARLFIDGVPAGTSPHSTRVDKDAKEHQIRAEAAGYEAATASVVFDRDARQVIRLAPAPPKGTAAADSVEPVNTKLRTTVSKARGAASPTANAARPSAGVSAASAKPVGARPNAPAIDTADPWQQ